LEYYDCGKGIAQRESLPGRKKTDFHGGGFRGGESSEGEMTKKASRGVTGQLYKRRSKRIKRPKKKGLENFKKKNDVVFVMFVGICKYG